MPRIDLGNNFEFHGIATPVDDNDATPKSYVDTNDQTHEDSAVTRANTYTDAGLAVKLDEDIYLARTGFIENPRGEGIDYNGAISASTTNTALGPYLGTLFHSDDEGDIEIRGDLHFRGYAAGDQIFFSATDDDGTNTVFYTHTVAANETGSNYHTLSFIVEDFTVIADSDYSVFIRSSVSTSGAQISGNINLDHPSTLHVKEGVAQWIDDRIENHDNVTPVIANPTGTDGDPLTRIEIDNTNYNIASALNTLTDVTITADDDVGVADDAWVDTNIAISTTGSTTNHLYFDGDVTAALTDAGVIIGRSIIGIQVGATQAAVAALYNNNDIHMRLVVESISYQAHRDETSLRYTAEAGSLEPVGEGLELWVNTTGFTDLHDSEIITYDKASEDWVNITRTDWLQPIVDQIHDDIDLAIQAADVTATFIDAAGNANAGVLSALLIDTREAGETGDTITFRINGADSVLDFGAIRDELGAEIARVDAFAEGINDHVGPTIEEFRNARGYVNGQAYKISPGVIYLYDGDDVPEWQRLGDWLEDDLVLYHINGHIYQANNDITGATTLDTPDNDDTNWTDRGPTDPTADAADDRTATGQVWTALGVTWMGPVNRDEHIITYDLDVIEDEITALRQSKPDIEALLEQVPEDQTRTYEVFQIDGDNIVPVAGDDNAFSSLGLNLEFDNTEGADGQQAEDFFTAGENLYIGPNQEIHATVRTVETRLNGNIEVLFAVNNTDGEIAIDNASVYDKFGEQIPDVTNELFRTFGSPTDLDTPHYLVRTATHDHRFEPIPIADWENDITAVEGTITEHRVYPVSTDDTTDTIQGDFWRNAADDASFAFRLAPSFGGAGNQMGLAIHRTAHFAVGTTFRLQSSDTGLTRFAPEFPYWEWSVEEAGNVGDIANDRTQYTIERGHGNMNTLRGMRDDVDDDGAALFSSANWNMFISGQNEEDVETQIIQENISLANRARGDYSVDNNEVAAVGDFGSSWLDWGLIERGFVALDNNGVNHISLSSFAIEEVAAGVSPDTWAITQVADAAQTFYQSDIPTTNREGDLWWRTGATAPGLYISRGDNATVIGTAAGQWFLIQNDNQIDYKQATVPTATAVGELWLDTSNTADGTAGFYIARANGANERADGAWELLGGAGGAGGIVVGTELPNETLDDGAEIGELFSLTATHDGFPPGIYRRAHATGTNTDWDHVGVPEVTALPTYAGADAIALGLVTYPIGTIIRLINDDPADVDRTRGAYVRTGQTGTRDDWVNMGLEIIYGDQRIFTGNTLENAVGVTADARIAAATLDDIGDVAEYPAAGGPFLPLYTPGGTVTWIGQQAEAIASVAFGLTNVRDPNEVNPYLLPEVAIDAGDVDELLPDAAIVPFTDVVLPPGSVVDNLTNNNGEAGDAFRFVSLIVAADGNYSVSGSMTGFANIVGATRSAIKLQITVNGDVLTTSMEYARGLDGGRIGFSNNINNFVIALQAGDEVELRCAYDAGGPDVNVSVVSTNLSLLGVSGSNVVNQINIVSQEPFFNTVDFPYTDAQGIDFEYRGQARVLAGDGDLAGLWQYRIRRYDTRDSTILHSQWFDTIANTEADAQASALADLFDQTVVEALAYA